MIDALPAPSVPPPARTRGSATVAAVGWLALGAGVALQRSLVVGFVVMAAIFVPFERAFPLRRQRRLRAQVWSDLVHLTVNRPVGNLAVLVAVVAVGIPLRALLVPAAVGADVAAQREWLQVVEAVVLGEIGGYWGHRAAHRVPLLWRFHRVHHSIVEMDFLAAGRTHPLDAVAMHGPAVLPLVMLGFSPLSIGGLGIVLTLVAIGVHANVRVRIPVLRWAIVTPEFHHWHHADEPDAYDRNFAPALPILDLVFRTAHLPADRMPSRYGIREEVGTAWAQHMVSPFRKTVPAAPAG